VKVWHPDRFEADSRVRTKAEAQLKRVNSAQDHLRLHWSPSDLPREDEPVTQDWTEVRTEPQPEYDSATSYKEEDVDTRSDLPTTLRYGKVMLRAVWRLFKLCLFAVLAVAVAAIVLLGMVAALSDYWRNEERIHNEPFFQSSGKRFFLSIAEWTGLPLAAARGFIFVFSALFIIAVVLSQMVWAFAVDHRVISIAGVGIACLAVLVWAVMQEQEHEFGYVPPGSKPPTSVSWAMGAVVLTSVVCSTPFLLKEWHSQSNPGTSLETNFAEVKAEAAAPISVPVETHVLLWDFRTDATDKPVPETVKLRLREAVEPLSGHPEALTFQGPIEGRFTDPNIKQQLYIVSLDWLTAERSHADGDRVFAVVLQQQPRVWELEGGGAGLRSLTISRALPDLLVTSPMWSGQGQTQGVLRIFSLADQQVKAIAATPVAYEEDCADAGTGTVADRVFIDVNSRGNISFSAREHWFRPCGGGIAYRSIGSESENAEEALIRMKPLSNSEGTAPMEGDMSAAVPIAGENVQTLANGADQTVSSALSAWAIAEESNDPAQQAECYSGQIDRYFLSRNVSRDYVRDYMSSWLKEHSRRVVSFVPKDVALEGESTEQVKVRLIKDVVTKDDQGTSERFTRSVLFLRKEGSQWKIFSEQDFK
jgi:hypothetical protein